MTRIIVIVANAVISSALAGIGLAGMVLRDPLLGGGYEWSTLLWIAGLVTFFFIPLEVCLIRTRKSGSAAPPSGKWGRTVRRKD